MWITSQEGANSLADSDFDAMSVTHQRPRFLATDASALWVIVLAGGDGARLTSLTGALYGQPLPKQFAVLAGEHSLLQTTLLRARCLAPWERIVVVVNDRHAALARRQCQALGPATALEQPANLGTGPGLLLPLAFVRAADPTARVLVLPSDHYVANPGVFVNALASLTEQAMQHPGLVLVGVEPDGPETDYGWILPGSALTTRPPALREVAGFVEKPSQDVAATLIRHRALWNTFILVGSADAFWATAVEYLPDHAERFSAYARFVGTPSERARLRDLYADLPQADFSVAVLQRARGLAVAAAPGCGWSDWGTPERVFESLAGTPALDRLQQRLRLHVVPDPRNV